MNHVRGVPLLAVVATQIPLAGISRGRLFRDFRPDLRALSLLLKAGTGHDDRILRTVAGDLEQEGITIVSPLLYLNNLLAPPGRLSRRQPNPHEFKDITYGFRIAKAVGGLDLGAVPGGAPPGGDGA